jgi:large subunit ribosomal protein L10
VDKEQKTAVVEEIAEQISGADAVFAVDYRGISVPQAAELRARLRDADATFRVVKNSLTERAADKAGADALRALLEGPTALTFVHGDAAVAAKAIADFQRATDVLEFKGGLLGSEELSIDQIKSIARLPARDVLYAQLVGTVGSPLTGLVRGLNALIAGMAIQLQQIVEQGLIAAGEPAETSEEPAAETSEEPAAAAEEPAAETEEPAAETEEPTAEAEEAEPESEEPAAKAEEAEPESEEPTAEDEPPAAEVPAEEEAVDEPAAQPDNETDASTDADEDAKENA